MMKQKNNQLIIITSVMCLLPILLSIVVYSELPSQIAVHWNNAGVADNYLPKALVAFGLPVLFLVLNIYSKLQLFNDPRRMNYEHAQSVQLISTWLIPILALILVPVTLFLAIGINISITMISSAVLGILFILIGNYLPKCRQNYTIGYKLPWALNDVDNWNKTHHIAGYIWIVGGLIVIVASFLTINQSILGISIVALISILLVVIPTLYSYNLYKNSKV